MRDGEPAAVAVADRPVVVFYSRTGTTERVARDLERRLEDPVVLRIRPETERPYWRWLARSFVPGSTVPIEALPTDLRAASALYLGTPKWTLSCPPTTAYLNALDATGVPTGLVLTFGGFDERRYARRYADRLANAGADVRALLYAKRVRVGGETYDNRLDEFREQVETE